MEIEKITDLVQKLLNLSKSPNEHEAALALQKAQELLEQHNLTLADLELKADTIRTLNMVNIPVPIGGTQWKIYMLNSISQLNFCHCVVIGKETHILGREENVLSSIVMASWIISQLENIAFTAVVSYEGPVPKLKWKNSFLWGAEERVSQRLREEKSKRLQSSSNLTALTVDLKAETNRWVGEQYRNLKRHQSSTTSLSSDGYNAGREAGDRVSLYGTSHQLKGGSQLLLS